MPDLEDKHQLPMKRVREIEKSHASKRRTHIVWWDLWETRSEMEARIERKIAEGKASRNDKFVIMTWIRDDESCRRAREIVAAQNGPPLAMS